jgi:hypothetical protein
LSKEGEGEGSLEVLELDVGEGLVHFGHELFDEGDADLLRETALAETEVEGVGEELLVVRSEIEADREGL